MDTSAAPPHAERRISLPELSLTVIRCGAIVVTGLLMAVLLRGNGSGLATTYYSLVLSLGFAHYAASFIYARRPLRALGTTAFATFALVALAAANVALYLVPKNQALVLLLYFGIHHVFNEAYLSHRSLGSRFAGISRLRGVALLLNAVLYLCILSRDPLISDYFDARVVVPLLIVVAAAFAVELKRTAPSLDRAQLTNLASLEVLGAGVAVLVLAFGLHVGFLDLVLYHFVFWAFYPALRMALAKNYRAVARYAGLNAALLAASLAVSPAGLWPYPLTGSLFLGAFYFFSYVHIGASFAISDQHPGWIIGLFRPGAPAVAARG